MTSPSDMGPVPETGVPADPAAPPSPANWREALMGLVASRVSLIELEAREAACGGARRAGFYGGVAACLFFAWVLFLTGGIGLLAEKFGWPWYFVALGAALLHILIAIILLRLAKPSGSPAFPVTRAEFKKDREWIENFQKTKNSNG